MRMSQEPAMELKATEPAWHNLRVLGGCNLKDLRIMLGPDRISCFFKENDGAP